MGCTEAVPFAAGGGGCGVHADCAACVCMVPSLAVGVEEWPRTSSGKIDRRRLPQADAAVLEVGSVIAPRSAAETAVRDAFASVLSMAAESISVEASFFELGGNSLKAVRLYLALKTRLGHGMNATDLLRQPTVAWVAAALNRAAVATVPLRQHQKSLAELGWTTAHHPLRPSALEVGEGTDLSAFEVSCSYKPLSGDWPLSGELSISAGSHEEHVRSMLVWTIRFQKHLRTLTVEELREMAAAADVSGQQRWFGRLVDSELVSLLTVYTEKRVVAEHVVAGSATDLTGDINLPQYGLTCSVFSVANLIYKSELKNYMDDKVKGWLCAWSFDDGDQAVLPDDLLETYLKAVASFWPEEVAQMTEQERLMVSQWEGGYADCFLYALLQTGPKMAVSRELHQLKHADDGRLGELQLLPLEESVDISIDAIKLPNIPLHDDAEIMRLILTTVHEHGTAIVGGLLSLMNALNHGHTVSFVISHVESSFRWYDSGLLVGYFASLKDVFRFMWGDEEIEFMSTLAVSELVLVRRHVGGRAVS